MSSDDERPTAPPDRAGPSEPAARDLEASEPPPGERPEPSPFPHPPWTVNLILVGGVITLLFGLLVNPIWLLVGSPFVLVLLLWLYVRLFGRS